MAENEELDASNRRFRWVVADLLRGRPPEEIADRIIKKLCAAWNYVRRHGFNAVAIVDLANAGDDLTNAVRDTGGSDFAHLIRTYVGPMQLPGTVLDAVNRTAIEQVIDSGLQQVACHPDGLTVLEAAHLKRQVVTACELAIPSITNALLGGIEKRVRSAKRLVVPSVPAMAFSMPRGLLEQSLLPSAQRQAAGRST